MNFSALILTLAIIVGQLIKIPLSKGGITILDLVVILFCIYGLLKLKIKLSKPPFYIIAGTIFIFVSIVSLIFSPLHLYFNQTLTSFLYIVRFSSYIIFGWLIYSQAFKNFNDQISNIIIISGTGLAILGLFQIIFLPDLQFLSNMGWDPHYFRTVSTFFDPNFIGAYFVLTLILLINGNIKQKLNVFLILVVYTALLTTFSRSSYLIFLISLLSLSFFKKSKVRIVLTIIFFLGLILGFQIYTQMVAKVRNIDREQSATFRLNTWQQGLTMFQTYPLLGVGFNNYRYALEKLDLGDNQFINSHGASSNDSSILFVAATTGVLGLLAYLTFLSSLIWKSKNYVLLSGLCGLLIHSLFANSLFFPPILLWLILISSSPKK